MKYAEAIQMVKQASKWLPAVAAFGSKAQLAKALNTRLWQKAVQSTGRPAARLSAAEAFGAARQAMRTAPKGTSMAGLYRAFRQDPSTEKGARSLFELFKTTPAETVPAYGLRNAVNKAVQARDRLGQDKRFSPENIVPDSRLLSRKQIWDSLSERERAMLDKEVLDKSRRQANPNAHPLTADDIIKEFGTNKLLFHGHSNDQGHDSATMLNGTNNRPLWLTGAAPVAVSYAKKGGNWDAYGTPVMSVFPMPSGSLGRYTERHFTPHLMDSLGIMTALGAASKGLFNYDIPFLRLRYGRDVIPDWSYIPNYEFVLRPGVRQRWLDASRKLHEPKSYYVVGELPENTNRRVDIQPGLRDASLSNLRFYDTAEGVPRALYDWYLKHNKDWLINSHSYRLPKGWAPRFRSPEPDESVFR